MFDQIFDAIEEWMRGLLTGIIHSNLDRMFTDVNEKTSEIAVQVGTDPAGLEQQHIQYDRKLIGNGDPADCRDHHHICALL